MSGEPTSSSQPQGQALSGEEAQAWAQRLEALGLAVRRQLIAVRDTGQEMATAVAQEGGDTIFAIDRHIEPVIEAAIESWPAECKPLLLVAEGCGQSGCKRFGRAPGADGEQFVLIVDPIDGTRNIMYDKRSAWFIAAVAEGPTGCKVPGASENEPVATPASARPGTVGRGPLLRDAFAAVIVELPTSKAGFADSFSAVKGGPAVGRRVDLRSGAARPLAVRPSRATTLLHGFAQVSNFFPGTKVMAAELMEHIAWATLGDVEPGSAAVFDDQYLTTAGQFVELMIGHDRFCCDLRPLFYRLLERRSGVATRGLECHPYDIAGMLVAQQAGVILTDGLGAPLNAPLNVHHGVHWCGYANEALRRAIEPVILQWFQERGVHPGDVTDAHD